MTPTWLLLLVTLQGVAALPQTTALVENAIVGTETSCEGSQAEWGICPMSDDCPEPEVTDCAFNDWSEWAGCDCTGLQLRQRTVLTHNNKLGKPCDGALIETTACVPKCHEEPVDCALGEWADWEGDCATWDAQKTKTRDITQSPLHGGKSCEDALSETIACGTKPPPPVAIDCAINDWDAWSTCSVTCGAGQKHRERAIKTPAKDGGMPCTDFLKETVSCEDGVCPNVDECVWNDWSEYSACTCSCGGGQKTRFRGIKQAPKNGGGLCPTESKSEIAACHTQSCEDCVDGAWNDWSDWDTCSATCDGGISLRTRTVAVTANHCGVPVSGSSTEAASCNTQVCHADEHLPCVFSVWSEWSDCSCTCNGVKRRARTIKSYGTGSGAFCEGALGEVEPCNFGESAPAGCQAEPAIGCVMESWAEWGPCSASCNGGQQTRHRKIETPASGGGKPCQDATEESQGCSTNPCEGPAPIPCMWQDWSEWGACDKCGGQKKRFRHIAEMAENAGAACDQQASEETAECPRECGATIYCEWQDWGEWSSCPNKVCEKYKRERKRILMASAEEPTMTQAKFESLRMQQNVMEAQHMRDLAVSFACGLFTFAAVLSVVRVFAQKRSRASEGRSLESIS